MEKQENIKKLRINNVIKMTFFIVYIKILAFFNFILIGMVN